MAKQLGMVIDLYRCIGCHTCAVACKGENNLPNGIWWNRILTKGGEDMDTPSGIFPNVRMVHYPLNCQHCENPACVKVCPVGATYKDAETGVVRQDYDKCIGCRMCVREIGCPGIVNADGGKVRIDPALCVGCGLCADICPIKAIGGAE